MKDFLGNEYGPGDKVLYAAGSGRSITMVLAEVVKIRKVYRDPDSYSWADIGVDDDAPFERRWNRETKQYEPTDERVETQFRVSVQPLKSSRWEQHSGKDHYIDSRTGKEVDPYYGASYHDPEIWVKLTGFYKDGKRYEDQSKHHYELINDGYHYEYGALQPYIEKRTDPPKPVTLTVTKNIVKWTG